MQQERTKQKQKKNDKYINKLIKWYNIRKT